MHLTFSTQHIHGGLGDTLKDYVKQRLTDMLSKHIHLNNKEVDGLLTVNVHFSKDTHGFNCSIIISRLVSGHLLKAEGISSDIDDAFEEALHKLEKPLRKYQGFLKEHQDYKTVVAEKKAIKYVINAKHYDEQLHKGEEPEHNIMGTEPLAINTMNVNEAIMKMELEDLPVLMFRNITNNKISVIYYGKDGNISLIDYEP